MTVNELITDVDDLKPNMYDDAEKIRWLNVVEGRIFKEIISTHESEPGMEELEFNGYNEDINMDTVLLAEEPYAELYKYYLMSMIDLHNEEYERYQNWATMFNTSYQEFANYWNRTHKSKGCKRFRH